MSLSNLLPTNISQEILIPKLNKELKKNNLSSELQLNTTGICHGLACVYAQYVLANEEKKFFSLLHNIATGNIADDTTKSEVYLLVAQVLLAYQPHQYISGFSQSNAFEMLKVDNKPLQSGFNFALATSNANWAKIIKELNLHENEVMLVSSMNHTVAIKRENGKYHIYDPNYWSGTKQFKSESALMRELHYGVFMYNLFDNTGLEIQIITTGKANRTYPAPFELYQKFLGDKNTKARSLLSGFAKFDTLTSAVCNVKDKDAVSIILAKVKPDAKTLFDIALSAVAHNNINALHALLPEIVKIEDKSYQKNVIDNLFYNAILYGNQEIFHFLNREPSLSSVEEIKHRPGDNFDKYFLNNNLLPLITAAAEGGNPELLSFVLEKFHQSENSFDLIENEARTKIISKAIRSPSSACVLKLIDEVQKYSTITDAEKLHFLRLAIQQNKSDVVWELLHPYKDQKPFITKDLLSLMKISTFAVGKTDLSVLTILEDHGMIFSKEAQEVIQEKAKKEKLSIFTLLDIFIGFLKNLFKAPQISFEANLKEKVEQNCYELIEKISKKSENTNEENKSKLKELLVQAQLDLSKLKSLTGLIQLEQNLQKVSDDIVEVLTLSDFIDLDGLDFTDLKEDDDLEEKEQTQDVIVADDAQQETKTALTINHQSFFKSQHQEKPKNSEEQQSNTTELKP